MPTWRGERRDLKMTNAQLRHVSHDQGSPVGCRNPLLVLRLYNTTWKSRDYDTDDKSAEQGDSTNFRTNRTELKNELYTTR